MNSFRFPVVSLVAVAAASPSEPAPAHNYWHSVGGARCSWEVAVVTSPLGAE